MSKLVHGEKYDYSKVNYKNQKTKVTIICPIHGEFQIKPVNHTFEKCGCQLCGKKSSSQKKSYTAEEFIRLAKIKHGNKYDYSKVVYSNCRVKIKLKCPMHGEFMQTPTAHLKASGCPKCGNNKRAQSKTSSQEYFIKSAKKIHNNKYDYRLVKYFGSKEKIDIICKTHGVFKQKPSNHLSGMGCPKCAGMHKTTNELICEFKKVHGNKYDYSLVQYINSTTKVEIICNKHGSFNQTPSNHLFGKKCPSCSESQGENKISHLLKLHNVKFESQKKFDNCKYKRLLRFDFYLPELNTCIEFQGIQHYYPRTDIGGAKAFKKQLIRDQIKKEYCKNNKIRLLEIKYTDNVEEILKKENIICGLQSP